MRWLIVFAFCSGCCADTFEIDYDTSKQPVAQLTSGSMTWIGTLSSQVVDRGYLTELRTSSDELVLHVPSLLNGSYATTIDLSAGTTVNVSITTSVMLQQVCMAPDQNDYGTGRCGYSFAGTIAITGDATATWTLDQIAYVAPGTPDC